MKQTFKLFLLLILVSNIAYAQDSNEISDGINNISGQWKIDLRPTPDSEAYYQSFVVDSIMGNNFTGTFYGSEIKNALLNKNWDKLYFAFSTSDQSNEYYHSGYLYQGKVYGISYCPNREFTAPWSGIKE